MLPVPTLEPLRAAFRDPSETNVEIANVVPTLAGHRYLLLTTTKRDGTTVPKPVWFAPDGDALVAATEADAWKVKRLRRHPEATVAPCDVRGRPLGAAVAVTGAILEREDDRSRADDALARRYGSSYAAIRLVGRARRLGRAPRRAFITLRPVTPIG
ncbi:MAG: PPOX class F420-dependent oxidoreductase [Solirubrobacteraceae bacterium]|nr:PPOX class F420-dependent oxidoreductase [Solirubrobacteraceae bacterium]